MQTANKNKTKGQQMQEIKYEFVDFFPNKSIRKLGKFHFLGTVSIHLIDAKMDLKGLPVVIKGKKMIVSWPWSWGFNPEREMPVRYSHWQFVDAEAEDALIDKLQIEVEERVLKWVAEHSQSAQAIGIRELWEEKHAPKADEPRKAKDKPSFVRPIGEIKPVAAPKTKTFKIDMSKVQPRLSANR